MNGLSYLESIWYDTHEKLKLENNYRKLNKYLFSENIKLNFSNNNYLGLKNDLRILEAGKNAAIKSGVGAGSSRSVFQSDTLIEELENYVASHTQFLTSVFFPSGFIANLAFFDVLEPMALENIDQEFFIDHRCHSSLFFNLNNKNLKTTIFKHNSLSHVEQKLKHSNAKVKIIVIESLFSMDGDFFDPQNLANLCKNYNAVLYIDESHSFGIYGLKGAGWYSEYPELKEYIMAIVFGCGKSVGVSGGFLVTSSLLLKERIIQKSKFFIYSTGISPFITGCVYQSLKIIFSNEGDEKRQLLMDNCKYLKLKVQKLSYNFELIQNRNFNSQIFPFVLNDNLKTMQAFQNLLDNNILVQCIRPPSVPQNSSRLRVCLTCEHSKNDIDLFINHLQKALK